MNYKYNFTPYYLGFLAGLLLIGCSDIQQPVPTNLQPALSVHPAGWPIEDSMDFHGLFIRNSDWDLKLCQRCHGVDYAGGIANKDCLTCHPATPEDCVVCHGGVDNLTGAPPEDLDGNQTIDARGVGTHSAHINGALYSDGVECQTCHLVPDSLNTAGHVDSDLPAEVLFSNLALVDNAMPIWDENSQTCMDSYCHGNWSLSKAESRFTNIYSADNLEGNAFTPNWTDIGTEACGTCHNLPPVGHLPYELSLCTVCHSTVIDANGNIINKTKHVNGLINVFLQEYPMF